MSLPRYKYLLTYRYGEIISDVTVDFCAKYIDKKSRTYDQMIQGQRSGKQCLVEGTSLGDTTKKGEMRLLGFSKSSYAELQTDFEDFLRQSGLEIYPKSHPKITEFRQIGYRLSNLNNLSHLGNLIEKPKLPGNPTDDANFLLTLCHIQTYLLDKQIKALLNKFETEGGFTESLYRRRISVRNSPKRPK